MAKLKGMMLEFADAFIDAYFAGATEITEWQAAHYVAAMTGFKSADRNKRARMLAKVQKKATERREGEQPLGVGG